MTVPISTDQLIEVIYRDVFKAAVDDCESVLERPPGRNPGQAALDASSWYSGLSTGDREILHSAIQKAADFAVFGMLCLLDNVRPIAEGFSQELRLSVEVSGERFDFDPNDPLHDIFRARVAAESEVANELSSFAPLAGTRHGPFMLSSSHGGKHSGSTAAAYLSLD